MKQVIRIHAPEDVSVIETDHLTRVYRVGSQEVQALKDVNLRIGSRQFVALMGRSGSGKTTLLNCLGGLDRPSSGRVSLFGSDLANMSLKQLMQFRREKIGFVFQSYGLLPTLSVFENIELMLRIVGAGKKERQERSNHCLELVGLTKWAQHRPYELSGGQQQRVSIARALANQPRLILADEPTGELDTTTARDILALFRRIVDEEGITLVLASHDMLVNEYVDRTLRMSDGIISLDGQV